MVQDLCLGLAFQPVPVFVLLSGHLLIEGRIQIVGIHIITPPFRYMREKQGRFGSPGLSVLGGGT